MSIFALRVSAQFVVVFLIYRKFVSKSLFLVNYNIVNRYRYLAKNNNVPLFSNKYLCDIQVHVYFFKNQCANRTEFCMTQ